MAEQSLDERLARLEAQHVELKTQLDENTQDTKAVREDTSKLVEILESWRGAIRVLEGVGRIFRPLSFVAVFLSAIAAFWAGIKNGIVPK